MTITIVFEQYADTITNKNYSNWKKKLKPLNANDEPKKKVVKKVNEARVE